MRPISNILGANGTGKTAIIKGIAKTQQTSTIQSELALKHPTLTRFSILQQGGDRFSISDSVLDTMCVPYILQGGALLEAEKRATELLDRFGLVYLLHRNIQTLSGGEDQLVHLLACLCGSPSGVIIDNPFGMVDHYRGQQLVDLFKQCSGDFDLILTHTEASTIFKSEADGTTIQLPGCSRLMKWGLIEQAKHYLQGQTKATSSQLTVKCESLSVERNTLTSQWEAIFNAGIINVIHGKNGVGKSLLLSSLKGTATRPVEFLGSVLLQDGTLATDGILFLPQHNARLLASRRIQSLVPRSFGSLSNEIGGSPVSSLSPGEIRFVTTLVAILRFLESNQWQWLLLDEPEAYLDSTLRKELKSLLGIVANCGKGIIITSHSTNWQDAVRWQLSASSLS